VQLKIEDILTSLSDSGIPVYFVAFYGETSGFPLSERSDLVGDELVDANWQSLGATVAVYPGTLSDGYIAQREQEGFDRYISPDKQIDASTCLFPETTWFVKNMRHEFQVNVLKYFTQTLAWTDNMTVTSNSAYPQFLTVEGNYTKFVPAQEVNEIDINPADYQPDMKTPVGFFAKIVAFFAKILTFFTNHFSRIG